MKRILITGASGFLGGVFVEAMRKLYEVHFTYSTRPVSFDGTTAHPLDICDTEAVKALVSSVTSDAVIHCAAIAHAGVCQNDPDLAQRVNVLGTQSVMQATQACGGMFFMLSTDLVFDGEHAPYGDDAHRDPVSVYGHSKRDAEDLVVAEEKGFVIRPALIYGPVSANGKGSFMQWMQGKLSAGEQVNLFHDEYRTPVYALDILRVIEALIQAGGGSHHVYNIGGAERVNRVEFAQAICDVYGYDPGCIVPTSQADVDTGYPRARDVSLANQRIGELGITPTPIREAIAEIAAKK